MTKNTLMFNVLLGVRNRSVCLVSALMLVGMAHAFGKVGHVQQSVRKTTKGTSDGSEV